MTTIQYLIGDATAPAIRGNKIICHVCNDAGAWGKGFVVALSRRWPCDRVEPIILATLCQSGIDVFVYDLG